VTQPLLLEQLHELGSDISAGQIERLLTNNKEGFPQEKAEVLSARLQTASSVGVDASGAGHDGKNGSCTASGNDLLAYFERSDSKSRLNFLTVLRRGSGYSSNEVTTDYWPRQQLPAGLLESLGGGPKSLADESAWPLRLQELGSTAPRPVLIASAGALLGQIIEQGASPGLVILSDAAAQFDSLVHASCWVHIERPLARLVPDNEAHRAEIEQLREQICELDQGLKTYRAKPDDARKPSLEARCDVVVNHKTN
jgi:hypothetical protein